MLENSPVLQLWVHEHEMDLKKKESKHSVSKLESLMNAHIYILVTALDFIPIFDQFLIDL
jgi:hypothetical protein